MDRALRLLEHLTAAEAGPTHAELARALDIPRSTLFEILGVLRRRGYVTAVDGRYHLGSSMVAISYQVSRRFNASADVRPALAATAARTGETSIFSVEIGGSPRAAGVVVPVDHVESTHHLRFVSPLGQPAPMHRTAAGMALLAFSGRSSAHVLGPDDASVDAAALDAELERIRARGYAIHRGGIFAGALSIAGPVSDPSDDLLGAISITGPAERLQDIDDAVWPVLRAALEDLHGSTDGMLHQANGK